MDTQLKATREEIDNVQLLLIAIERQTGNHEVDRLIQDANSSLMKTETHMFRLESQLGREPAPVRQKASFKMDQLKSDVCLIKNSLRTMTNRHTNRKKQAEEKKALLKQRFTTNQETRVNLEFDEELNLNDKLKYSDNMIDQMLAQGASVFEDLQKQKYNLLSIRKRFHFLTKSLGISDTTIRLIEKRVREDKKLFMIGVICCLIFMFCFYYWWQYC
ncbi:Golgi SNAP receptor complex member 2 [Caenorhabditis elegans]|uniref:Golgi SNAP receptor complex member 2 n=1 Tax=Caenorhabditis elegans TaxID=6239 RepID=Q21499_CAEEL|nr:Golgi SNAP receptor complex member 2 [Caenorhabditis elegans]CCD68245.1 Golgi SNAP receptor complex member 2 [Caenorhabditis elegans]|eukprot:NP_504484.2 Golgi SNAP receptor complex member 2 [Caenorhabditis elegans]